MNLKEDMYLPTELKTLIVELLSYQYLANLLLVSTEYCAIIKEMLRKRKNVCVKKNVVWALYNNPTLYDLELFKTSDEALEYMYDQCVESHVYKIKEDDVDISVPDRLTDSFGELYTVNHTFWTEGDYVLMPLFGHDIRKTFYVIKGEDGQLQDLTQDSDRAKELEEKYVVKEYNFT